jgi:hypothetical protein
LTKSYGIVGTAIAQLISISIYNCARVLFLWLTFKLQPFSNATLKAILLFIFISIGIHLIFKDQQGWLSLFGRSALYLASASIGVIYLKLTPDIKPVLQSIKKRLIKS